MPKQERSPRRESRVSLDLDPEEALRALLAVDPDAEADDTEDDASEGEASAG